MTRALVIARGELLLARSRLAWVGLATLLALSAVAAATSGSHVAHERAQRDIQQHATDALFAAQPDRHPHRMVHYGSYAYRPLGVLAAFDPGVDAYTGTTLYLEGHRQNSATFGAVGESSSLIRFGQLTPAFVLQVLAPLLLVFLGFAMVARERESGTLAQLRAHGATATDVLVGKGLALAAVAAAVVAPALVGAGFAVAQAPSEAAGAVTIAAAYLLYLLVWVALIVAVSALSRSSRGALIVLVALWTFAVVLVPRLAAEHAASALPLPSRAETDLVLKAELRTLGDSHDANDPFFAAFRARTLERHGVERIEDLPVNFRGLVSLEGEALTSRLFADYAARAAGIQRLQVARLQRAGLLSPALAVRRVSLAAAGTDLENHLRFLEQAEAHRFDMVQRLNRMHAEAVALADDAARNSDPLAERRSRVSRRNWAAIPEFSFVPEPAASRAARAWRALGVLATWLVAAVAVGVGLADVQRQRAAIERTAGLQAVEERAVQAHASDAGDAAYYSFLLTSNPPSDLAFAALGQRDVAPYMLRVRALALEAQIYENEAGNPGLALPGRFDFAFVLIYLAPLVLIALLHDLVSGERERGRLAVLRAMPGSIRRLWAARVTVRCGAVFVTLAVPFVAGAIVSGAGVPASAAFLGLIGLAVAFWSAVAVFVATRGWNSPVNATVLAAT